MSIKIQPHTVTAAFGKENKSSLIVGYHNNVLTIESLSTENVAIGAIVESDIPVTTINLGFYDVKSIEVVQAQLEELKHNMLFRPGLRSFKYKAC